MISAMSSTGLVRVELAVTGHVYLRMEGHSGTELEMNLMCWFSSNESRSGQIRCTMKGFPMLREGVRFFGGRVCPMLLAGLVSVQATAQELPTGSVSPYFARRMKPPVAQRNRPAPVIYTSHLLVELKSPETAGSLSRDFRLNPIHRLRSSTKWVVLEAGTPGAASRALAGIRFDSRVRLAYQMSIPQVEKDQFVPNDPYFPKDAPVAGWQGQWHLSNTHGGGIDVRVSAPWSRSTTGTGVVLGIVDDGLQTAHPDLSFNYTSSNSYDFGQNDTNPNPVFSDDVHGTAVAGVAAARGGNGIGVTGAAPNSALAGLRLDFSSVNFITHAVDATLYRSSGATTTIKIKNHSYGPSSPFLSSNQVLADAMATSAASGTIHVRSAGNGRGGSAEDANKAVERNLPQAVTVAALGSDGIFADYSNFGACISCTVPSGADSEGGLDILTTDRTGESAGYNGSWDTFPNADYTSQFGGTSSAAALASGVFALVKQVQPNLDSRFLKHLLARNCDMVDSADATEESDGGWKTNAAGFKFNQNYGFGLVNADKLTLDAPLYSGVTPLTTATVGLTAVNAAIPDNSTTGVTRTFNVAASDPLEEVRLTLNITHPYRGDIEAVLTSPSGTTSRLCIRNGSEAGTNLNWTFTSNAFWGEIPAGIWTLKVMDTFAVDTGTLNSYAAEFRMGTLIQAQRTVDGEVALGEFGGTVAGRSAVIQICPVGSQSVLETKNVVLGASGSYSFTTSLSGTYDLYCKSSHWLRKKRSSVVITSNVSGVDFALVNGDVDGDNQVTLLDYDAFSEAYDSTVGDGNFNPEADLDGDGSVTLLDYDIFSSHFDENGD